MTDIISVNASWTIWLLVHLLLSVALIGALTHQAVAVAMPVRKVAGPAGFVTRYRAVPPVGYATAVCISWVLTFIVGSYIYTKYRIFVRIPLEQSGFYWTQGFFDFKEHITTLGLVLLPGHWYFWKNAQNPEYDGARRASLWCSARCVGSSLSSATFSTTLEGSGHELTCRSHQHYHRHKGGVRNPISHRIGKVQDLRHSLLHFWRPNLRHHPVLQLADVHLPPCDKPLSLGL
jgi:hypothetical protein